MTDRGRESSSRPVLLLGSTAAIAARGHNRRPPSFSGVMPWYSPSVQYLVHIDLVLQRINAANSSVVKKVVFAGGAGDSARARVRLFTRPFLTAFLFRFILTTSIDLNQTMMSLRLMPCERRCILSKRRPRKVTTTKFPSLVTKSEIPSKHSLIRAISRQAPVAHSAHIDRFRSLIVEIRSLLPKLLNSTWLR